MRLLTIILLALLATPSGAEPDGVTSAYTPGQGYTITHRLTSPGTLAGTAITVAAQATWYNESGDVMGETTSEPFTVVVASETRRKDTVIYVPAGFQVVVDSGAGQGTMTFDGAKLTISQSVPNDGVQRTFTWRMTLKG